MLPLPPLASSPGTERHGSACLGLSSWEQEMSSQAPPACCPQTPAAIAPRTLLPPACCGPAAANAPPTRPPVRSTTSRAPPTRLSPACCRTAAADALQSAEIIEKTVEDIYELTFDYALMSPVMNTVKQLELEITTQDFGIIGKLSVAIAQSAVPEKLRELKAGIAEVRIEEVDRLEEVEGLKMNYLRTR